VLYASTLDTGNTIGEVNCFGIITHVSRIDLEDEEFNLHVHAAVGQF
jgi:hypothetical protein